jgi:TonB family protein
MKNQRKGFWVIGIMLVLVVLNVNAQISTNAIDYKPILNNDSDIQKKKADSILIEWNSRMIDYLERAPEFPGGEKELLNFIAKNLQYPTEDEKNGVEGRVIVRFMIRKTGKVENVVVIKAVSKNLDAEAVRVVSSLPDWNPGVVNGKKVDVPYILPISFRLAPLIRKNVYVDIMPQFPGGAVEVLSYIYKSLNLLLSSAKENDEYLPDVVTVGFIIDKNGKVINPEVIRGKNTLYNKISLQIISSMPDWIPGERNGKKVDVYYSLPIIFKLE